MHVYSIKEGAQDIRFKVHKKGISVFPFIPWEKDSSHTLEIVYDARPRRGMYFYWLE